MVVSPINTLDASVKTLSLGNSFVKYTITDANSCSNCKTMNTYIVNCAAKVSVAMEHKEFSIYPNPANSVINVRMSAAVTNGTLVVTDLYGKQLKQQSLSLGTNTVDVSMFAKGTYFITLLTD
ncbi:T9SS C-terminal target domain-containing protein, partial [bacterium]|nr:T9SS C-terminal target domain-containing protein [bacterium]